MRFNALLLATLSFWGLEGNAKSATQITKPKGNTLDKIPPINVSLTLRGKGLEHLTAPGREMVCTGGDWTFDWSGPVPGETASATALLRGDGMFVTKDELIGWNSPPRLEGQGIRCTVPDGLTGQPTLAFEGRLTPNVAVSVNVQVSMTEGNSYVVLAVDDAANCRVQLQQGQAFDWSVPLNINSNAGVGAGISRFNSPVQFTRDEIEKGFTKTWQVSAENFMVGASQCMGQNMQGDLTLRYKSAPNDPKVELDACLHLASGEKRIASALGAPEGGAYRFVSAPSSLLGITSSNATNQASVSAQTNGRGEFTVSYLVDGKSASKTVPASVVQLLRFDAPEMIELSLIDADGRNKQPYKVPFVSVPVASGDLLQFKGFDPKFLSLATGASELTLQGVRPGITSLQAETLCGTAVGPRLGVKVVTCDKDSRETLERRKRGVKERNDTISRRVQELLSDPEFVRVEREIKDDVINLAFKSGSTIVGALTMAQGGQIKAAEGRLSQLSPQQLKWLTEIKPEQASIKAIKMLLASIH